MYVLVLDCIISKQLLYYKIANEQAPVDLIVPEV